MISIFRHEMIYQKDYNHSCNQMINKPVILSKGSSPSHFFANKLFNNEGTTKVINKKYKQYFYL